MLDPDSILKKKPGFGPVSKAKVAENRLRAAILWCELQPGALVAEAGLAEQFGLGRAAVRSALAHLAAKGFVESVARLGWRILPINGALIGHIISARRLAEPVLSEAVLSDADRAACDRLVPMIAALEGQNGSGASNARRQYVRALDEVVLACINPLVRDFLSDLWDHSERIVRFLESGPGPRFDHDGTARFVAALKSGDAQGIRAVRLDAISAFERTAVAHLLNDERALAPRSAPPSGDAEKLAPGASAASAQGASDLQPKPENLS